CEVVLAEKLRAAIRPGRPGEGGNRVDYLTELALHRSQLGRALHDAVVELLGRALLLNPQLRFLQSNEELIACDIQQQLFCQEREARAPRSDCNHASSGRQSEAKSFDRNRTVTLGPPGRVVVERGEPRRVHLRVWSHAYAIQRSARARRKSNI